MNSDPMDLERIAFRDAAYGPDLAAPAALRQDYHGQCVWDRRALLAEVDRLRGQIAAVRALADKWEHGALRWADPLPVPPEVALIREALDGAA